jgi:putative component of toxin-antitoxin plasmid stabilization module
VRDLWKLGKKSAVRVAKAFIRLVETGRGDVKPVEPREAGFLELRVGLYLRGYFKYVDRKVVIFRIRRK